MVLVRDVSSRRPLRPEPLPAPASGPPGAAAEDRFSLTLQQIERRRTGLGAGEGAAAQDRLSLTLEQIELRRTGLGAGEVAAGIGMSAFGKGPLNVWASKVLPMVKEPEIFNPRRDMGNRMEAFIGQLYSEDTGRA